MEQGVFKMDAFFNPVKDRHLHCQLTKKTVRTKTSLRIYQ